MSSHFIPPPTSTAAWDLWIFENFIDLINLSIFIVSKNGPNIINTRSHITCILYLYKPNLRIITLTINILTLEKLCFHILIGYIKIFKNIID